jgi:hypothetical protein
LFLNQTFQQRLIPRKTSGYYPLKAKITQAVKILSQKNKLRRCIPSKGDHFSTKKNKLPDHFTDGIFSARLFQSCIICTTHNWR